MCGDIDSVMMRSQTWFRTAPWRNQTERESTAAGQATLSARHNKRLFEHTRQRQTQGRAFALRPSSLLAPTGVCCCKQHPVFQDNPPLPILLHPSRATPAAHRCECQGALLPSDPSVACKGDLDRHKYAWQHLLQLVSRPAAKSTRRASCGGRLRLRRLRQLRCAGCCCRQLNHNLASRRCSLAAATPAATCDATSSTAAAAVAVSATW